MGLVDGPKRVRPRGEKLQLRKNCVLSAPLAEWAGSGLQLQSDPNGGGMTTQRLEAVRCDA